MVVGRILFLTGYWSEGLGSLQAVTWRLPCRAGLSTRWLRIAAGFQDEPQKGCEQNGSHCLSQLNVGSDKRIEIKSNRQKEESHKAGLGDTKVQSFWLSPPWGVVGTVPTSLSNDV